MHEYRRIDYVLRLGFGIRLPISRHVHQVLRHQHQILVFYIRRALVVVVNDLHDEGDKGVHEYVPACFIVAPDLE